jgi:hypothetical protein
MPLMTCPTCSACVEPSCCGPCTAHPGAAAPTHMNCAECGSRLPVVRVIEVADSYDPETLVPYCSPCASRGTFRCVSCDERRMNTQGTRAYGDERARVCQACAAEFNRCRSCSIRYREDEEDEECSSSHCPTCYSRVQTIRPYDYTPPIRIFALDSEHVLMPTSSRPGSVRTSALPDDLLLIGTEVEIENHTMQLANESAASTLNATEVLYCKRDGSLRTGFEVVSHPFSFGWIKENLGKLGPLFKLADSGYRAYHTDTCGMHVHMSKAAFTRAHLYKFLAFFYGCPRFVEYMSRRKRTQLQQWASTEWARGGDRHPANVFTSMPRAATLKTIGEGDHAFKYRAVNLEKEHTVEVRIFRSTLAMDGYMRNIEFCVAVFDYTRDCSLREQASVWPFVRFVSRNRKRYPSLAAFLDKNTAKIKEVAA